MSLHTVRLARPDDFEGWRQAAKTACLAAIPPAGLLFEIEGESDGLFAGTTLPAPRADAAAPRVPKSFVDLARQVVCHSDPERFALLYRLLWRLQSERTLMMQPADRDVHRANALAKEVRRDAHKMKAFVRFRKVDEHTVASGDKVESFIAWFEPTHHIIRHTAPFFARRFAGMDWSILTPKGCVHWTYSASQLVYSDAVGRENAPAEDALEDYWRTYYASIFNPARLKVDAMKSEMPMKYWHNLPEAALIPGLIKGAREREQVMRDNDPTEPSLDLDLHKSAVIADRGESQFPSAESMVSLETVRTALKACTACPLYRPATQVVPGKGPENARLMMVGEQPGDREDLAGEPFIGPAGTLLRELMAEVGIDPEIAYVTNAVKHFKFEPRGKRRIHKNPTIGEIDHCSWWLAREIELVQPRIVMALGGSAVRALTGRSSTIKALRGTVHDLDLQRFGRVEANAPARMVVSNHPSFILRVPHEGAREAARAGLVEDLVTVRELLTA